MGADLTALSVFFDEKSWRQPVAELSKNAKGFILNQVGYRLRALGRLAEAIQPIQASLDAHITQKDWNNAAISACNLSDINLTIGDVKGALAYAEQSVEFADKSGDEFKRVSARPKLANAMHQQGDFTKAEAVYREAEEIQKKRQPKCSLLYSDIGFQYCDLLLSQRSVAEVERRVNQTLEWGNQYLQQGGSLLWIALDNLSLGRAHLLHAQRDSKHPYTESLSYLNRAVDGLRQAGTQHMLPLGLLARAEYYRVTGDLNKAQKDLDEAFAIASRGGMGLHLADCHLEYARLSLRARSSKQSPSREGIASSGSALLAMTPEELTEKAREHWQTARESIEKMGYHRRDKEVEELEEQLK